MSNLEMTHRQARALARFLNELRPDWDVAGIEAQLGYARGKAAGADLAIAAIRAAMSPKARTPAVIGMDGEHWRAPAVGTVTASKRPVHPSELCRVCGKTKAACELIAANPLDGHRYERVGDPVLADPVTGELVPTRDYSEGVAELRDEMSKALALPE